VNLRGKKVLLHEMSLRDGMHPKRHQIRLSDMVAVATALDEAGVPFIEVTHGDGLGGASINYGFPLHTDQEYLEAVCPKMKRAKISALLLPGIGTVDELRMAVGAGVGCVRVATHCTEADVSKQHIGLARKLGVDTVGFLMMAHMIEPEKLLAHRRQNPLQSTFPIRKQVHILNRARDGERHAALVETNRDKEDVAGRHERSTIQGITELGLETAALIDTAR